VSLVYQCQRRSILETPRFVSVGIGASSRLVPTNICNNALVPTNYKEKFFWFSIERVST
jgi:hypothetical protein